MILCDHNVNLEQKNVLLRSLAQNCKIGRVTLDRHDVCLGSKVAPRHRTSLTAVKRPFWCHCLTWAVTAFHQSERSDHAKIKKTKGRKRPRAESERFVRHLSYELEARQQILACHSLLFASLCCSAIWRYRAPSTVSTTNLSSCPR